MSAHDLSTEFDLVAARLTNVVPEIIDAAELARRIGLPKTWIENHTRARAKDVIPHVKFGKYTRFEWGSTALERWIAAHRQTGRKGQQQ